jgi:N-acetylmuramoyl-L-alanine amidase
MEVYVDHSKNKKSIALGVSILNESTQKLGFKKRGVKFANFQVLRKAILHCPSVLVELGFMTNSDEADYFLEAKNIKTLALAILMGIMIYFIRAL